MPLDIPVITNSAGCGSAMKEYGHLLATDKHYSERAMRFANRVKDISEFLYESGFEPPKSSTSKRVAYHDACHLSHGQGIRIQPRDLLASLPGTELIELEESDRCCGSAGVYNLTQPKLARELLERKWKFIEEAKPDVVATGNPGCLAWIAQAAIERRSAILVKHTAVVLAEAYLQD
jgi:glycolate oxidase iron-sulfur subunit